MMKEEIIINNRQLMMFKIAEAYKTATGPKLTG